MEMRPPGLSAVRFIALLFCIHQLCHGSSHKDRTITHKSMKGRIWLI